METEQVDKIKKEVKRKAANLLNSKTIANAPPEKLIEMREAFEERLEREFQAIHSENMEQSQEHCQEIYETLHSKVKEKLLS
jgi:hypothetical protein